ncbi:hypothetical protein A2368_01325 [Candidatus Collierbacteria bacterium RIFOXYB1_FULL_49_13]|uniref:Uncharacterized protein n=1 Tax=Candidatus Collierbacteria bacterium RIFOXYB1_FULL_49_13 TaxID=1817728 RepID=A0A1F5FIC7_9BACT|nr:MAG: hypothetical protein A2368_01325 [Candidatus Collierbacteria bacterium RIFOXYB1_FULL_49_13]
MSSERESAVSALEQLFDEAWMQVDNLMWRGSRDVNPGMVGDGMGSLERAVILERRDVWIDRYGPVDLRLAISGEGVNFYRAKITDPSKTVISFEVEVERERKFQVLARLQRERGLVTGYIYDFEVGEVLSVARERNNGNMGRCVDLIGKMLVTALGWDKTTFGKN